MERYKRPILLIIIHLLGCFAFLALPYMFAEDGLSKLAELPDNPHEQRNGLSYLLTIAFFYTNYFVLIPRLYVKRKYFLYGLCVLSCFLITNQILSIVNRRAQPYGDRLVPPLPPRRPQPPVSWGGRPPEPGNRPPSAPQPGLPPEINQTFFLFLAGMLLSLAIRINNRWRETERERLNTELSYLKAQINPHFLFNTLNSIYSLAIEQSPPTAQAIVQLSSFLRYVIAEARQDWVSLSHELAYISHYVALQKLRLDDTVQIEYTTQGETGSLQIAPLLLITFIENAFKYGASPQEPSQIDIRIRIIGNELHCHVFNRKVRAVGAMAVASGIGLTNTKTRLNLLYPGQHRLAIADEPDHFTVDLSITLS